MSPTPEGALDAIQLHLMGASAELNRLEFLQGLLTRQIALVIARAEVIEARAFEKLLYGLDEGDREWELVGASDAVVEKQREALKGVEARIQVLRGWVAAQRAETARE
jgi:hypothetical protein